MPRHERLGQAEAAGEGGEDRRPLLSERGEGAGRAPQGCRQPAQRLVELAASSERPDQPSGGFRPEGGGQRRLQEGAGGDEGVAVAFGERGAAVGESGEVRVDQPPGTVGDEHGGAVEDVLAGRPEMNPVRRCWGQLPAQRHH